MKLEMLHIAFLLSISFIQMSDALFLARSSMQFQKVMKLATCNMLLDDMTSRSERVATATSINILLDAITVSPASPDPVYPEVYFAATKRLVKFLIGVSSGDERSRIVSSDQRFVALCHGATHITSTDESSLFRVVDSFKSLASLSPLPDNLIQTIFMPAIMQVGRSLTSKGTTYRSSICPELVTFHWACEKLNISRYAQNDADLKKVLVGIENSRNAIQLPFKVFNGITKSCLLSVEDMLQEVPFKAETLITRDGKNVQERRETCWMADPNIGGLAYSGKIMSPVPFTPCIDRVRERVEEVTGVHFDCCLINHYPDGECACKFHSDPDHGRLWARETIVISVGETRRFNFRKIPKTQSQTLPHGYAARGLSSFDRRPEGCDDSDDMRNFYSFHVFDGDGVFMFDDCQDAYQHAVMKSEGSGNNGPRCSIVFKKSLPGPGGRRGHGIPKAPTSKYRSLESPRSSRTRSTSLSSPHDAEKRNKKITSTAGDLPSAATGGRGLAAMKGQSPSVSSSSKPSPTKLSHPPPSPASRGGPPKKHKTT